MRSCVALRITWLVEASLGPRPRDVVEPEIANGAALPAVRCLPTPSSGSAGALIACSPSNPGSAARLWTMAEAWMRVPDRGRGALMGLTWADLAQAVVGGLAAVLGVQAAQAGLAALRRRGVCPERWVRARTFLLRRRRRWEDHSAWSD